MLQALRSWWLLAVCTAIYAAIAILYWTARQPPMFHRWHHTVVLLGELTLAAGICTVTAGIRELRRRNSWLLVLSGLACSALGAIFAFWNGPLAFRTVAILIVVMAASIGIYELTPEYQWPIHLTGIASLGFAAAFLAFVFRWIKLDPGSPAQSLHWLGSYFGCCALCMLVLTFRLHGPGLPRKPM